MDNTYAYSSVSSNPSLAISLAFLIIAISLIVIIIIYFIVWRVPLPSKSCQSTNQCSITQVCVSGVCDEKVCRSSSDCDSNSTCINSYCVAYKCSSGNDCLDRDNSACVNGECTRVGSACTTNNDCHNLSCMNSVCVQCLSDSDCPTGQGCFEQICRYPYAGETGPERINYPSSAQNNGNITAPPGYICPTSICGTGPTGHTTIPCNNTNACPSSCGYCIDSVCRCSQGKVTEICRNNTDCESGLCSANKVCILNPGECIFNYSGTACENCCPASAPYCASGKCSEVSLGAVCGATGLPSDLCSNPQSLGVSGPTGITQNGMGFFCVNGTCQSTPGNLNDLCTDGSCATINNISLVCTPTETPNIPLLRCLTT